MHEQQAKQFCAVLGANTASAYMQNNLESSAQAALLHRAANQITYAWLGMTNRERERDLREETVYFSPAWDCGKGSLV